MFRISREIHFCYGHRLLHHQGKCRYLHGHNGRVVVALAAAQLDELGMVIDFGDIKQTLSRWILEQLDHRMLLHREDPLLPVLLAHAEPVFIMDGNPTAENIARLIYETAKAQGLPVVEVVLWETADCCAAYSEQD